MSIFNRTVQLINPRHCTPISIKIHQYLLKLWTVFLCPTVYMTRCCVRASRWQRRLEQWNIWSVRH